MGASAIFPELHGNFTPVPDLLFLELLKAGLSREELLVTLFLVHKTFEFRRDMTLVPVEAIVASTDLDRAAAQKGLDEAIERGTVLQFHTESSSSPKSFYLLSTEENLRVAGPLDLGDFEVAEAAPAKEEPAAPPKIEPPAPVAAKVPVRSREDRAGGTSISDQALARIRNVVGRALTKDEQGRLEELRPDEDLLDRSLESLEARKVEVYSSDLVIYEYESLRTSERRTEDDTRRRSEMDEAQTRQRTCKKCNGLGYVFIGVNTVEECSCRNAR